MHEALGSIPALKNKKTFQVIIFRKNSSSSSLYFLRLDKRPELSASVKSISSFIKCSIFGLQRGHGMVFPRELQGGVIPGKPGLWPCCFLLLPEWQNASPTPPPQQRSCSSIQMKSLFELRGESFSYHYHKSLEKNSSCLIFFSGRSLRLSHETQNQHPFTGARFLLKFPPGMDV